MRKLSAALSLIAIFIAGTLGASAQTHTIRGVIQEFGSAIGTRPLPGATVALTPGSRSAVTDASGNYSIGGVPSGTYSVRFSAPGHKTVDMRIAVTRDIELNYALQVQEATTTAHYDLAGLVTESGSFGTRPIAGATVKVMPGGMTATTDANGRYVFNDIASKTYTVTASATGHRTASRKITLASDTELGLNLAVNTTTPGSGSDGSVSGVLRNGDGSAISGASIRLTPGNYTATTKSDGSFSFGNVPNGTYMMHIKASGFPTTNRKVTIGSDRTIEVRMDGARVEEHDSDDDGSHAKKGKKGHGKAKGKANGKGHGKGKGHK